MASNSPEPGSGVRVLVVDDYHPFADLIAAALYNEGHEARAAYDGAEALHVAEGLKPHALIADAHLSDMDGWRLGAEVERRFPGCKILLMSADTSLFRPPPDAPPYKLVEKSLVTDELQQLLVGCDAPE